MADERLLAGLCQKCGGRRRDALLTWKGSLRCRRFPNKIRVSFFSVLGLLVSFRLWAGVCNWVGI